jgi:hypothetical protein
MTFQFSICPNCNEENPAGTRYCQKCGKSLTGEAPHASAQNLPIVDAAPPAPPKSNTARYVVGFVILAIILFVVSQLGLYAIQPIKALPQGETLLVWRAPNEPFFNSSDAVCLKTQNYVSLLCRGRALGELLLSNRVIARLPYMHWVYLQSTGGKEFEQ